MNPLPLDESADDFAAMATQYLAGEADADAVARLNRLLLADAALRARFAILARLHGQLAEIGRHAASGAAASARLLASGAIPQVLPTVSRQRASRRWAGWAVAAAMLIAVGVLALLLGATALRAQYLVPIIARTEGAVLMERGGATVELKAGIRLRVGDLLRLAAGSRATIALRGGTCELAAGTEAVVEEVEGLRRRITLRRGEMTSDVTLADTPLAVQTEAATIAVRDAVVRITVTANGTAIVVSRGSVEIQPIGGAVRSLPAGQRLDLPTVVAVAQPAGSYAVPSISQAVVAPTGGMTENEPRMSPNQSVHASTVPGNPTTRHGGGDA